jgi:hypothetical protein
MAKTSLTLEIEMSRDEMIDLICDAYNFVPPESEPGGEIEVPGVDVSDRSKPPKKRTVKIEPHTVDAPKLREEFAVSLIGQVVSDHMAGLKRKLMARQEPTKNVTASFQL